MSAIKLFDFEGHDVRITDLDGNPWWLANDVCEVLGYANGRQAVGRLDDDDRNTVYLADGNRGNPNKTIINESGLYALILGSDKPEAKRFKKWVTSEVLPSIRKDGGYIVAQPTDTPEVIMARAVLVANETIERMKLQAIRLGQSQLPKTSVRNILLFEQN